MESRMGIESKSLFLRDQQGLTQFIWSWLNVTLAGSGHLRSSVPRLPFGCQYEGAKLLITSDLFRTEYSQRVLTSQPSSPKKKQKKKESPHSQRIS